MADYAIDASSVLTYAFNEPGADIVVKLAADNSTQLLISSVNMAEVLAKMIDKGMTAEVAADVIAPLALAEIPFDPSFARLSSELRNATRSSGLSLGDRSCLALGLIRKLPTLTSDRKWLEVLDKVGIQIIITRPA